MFLIRIQYSTVINSTFFELAYITYLLLVRK